MFGAIFFHTVTIRSLVGEKVVCECRVWSMLQDNFKNKYFFLCRLTSHFPLYQYTHAAALLQSVFLLLPAFIWTRIEGQRVSAILSGNWLNF